MLSSNTGPRYLVAIIAWLLSASAAAEKNDSPWAVTVYQTVLTADPIEDVITGGADYDEDFQLTALALSHKIPSSDPRYDFEWELQAVKHTQGQDHEELNALIGVRWYPFPWDSYLNTDFAAGAGVSYATALPEFEVANHDDAEQFLAYILLELEFRPRRWDNWSIILRSHHRSGAFGLFNGVQGASNSLGIGVKYRFD